MKNPNDILALIKEQMAEVEDSTDLTHSMGWFCDQFNSLIIAMNDYDKEKPKSVIVLDNGESLKAYKGKVYKSHYRYRHGAIYSKESDDYIYFNPEMNNNIEFEKPNQLLLDLGYVLKEYISLVTEELSLINAQNLDARVNHRYNVGGRVINFLGVVWHDPNSVKKFPKIQIKCSWVIQSRVGLDQDFGHSINNGKTPDLKLEESIPMGESFESHNFYLKLMAYELPSKNKAKETEGIMIGTLNPDDKKIVIYVKGDPVRNKEELDHFNKIIDDYNKRNSDE